MKNSFLKQLNFEVLLQYPSDFKIANFLTIPIDCHKYCVNCEEKGIEKPNQLTCMSHACATEDIVEVLGRMPNSLTNNNRVMFVLENPGGNLKYDIGDWVTFQGKEYKKHLPINHYYFTPTSENWIENIDELIQQHNFYGNYFSYLINKFGFINCYITNAVKCRIVGTYRYSKEYYAVAENCRVNFFLKELELFDPTLIICFGQAASNLTYLATLGKYKTCKIYHPASIQASKRYGKTKEEMFQDNDKKIENAL